MRTHAPRRTLDARSSTRASTRRWPDVITAGTTLLAVVALYLFGGEVLEGFAFTMLVGIITGTYSTCSSRRRSRSCWQGAADAGGTAGAGGARRRSRRGRSRAAGARRSRASCTVTSSRRAARGRPGTHRVPAGLELGAPDPGARVLRLRRISGGRSTSRPHRHAPGASCALSARPHRAGASCRGARRRDPTARPVRAVSSSAPFPSSSSACCFADYIEAC